MAHFAHPTACIEEGAHIGEGTRIWNFTKVMPGARIGEGCNIGQNVYVGRDVVVGNRVKLQNNVSVYEGVTLEDDVFCGPSMVFTNVKTPRSAFPRAAELISTRVQRGATICANATVVCGVTIGRWAFVGAGSVVTHDVPPFALVIGVPARQVGWACICGPRLQPGIGPDRFACPECGRTYVEREETLVPEAVEP